MSRRILSVSDAKKDINSSKRNVFAIINFINKIMYVIHAKMVSNAIFISI